MLPLPKPNTLILQRTSRMLLESIEESKLTEDSTTTIKNSILVEKDHMKSLKSEPSQHQKKQRLILKINQKPKTQKMHIKRKQTL